MFFILNSFSSPISGQIPDVKKGRISGTALDMTIKIDATLERTYSRVTNIYPCREANKLKIIDKD